MLTTKKCLSNQQSENYYARQKHETEYYNGGEWYGKGSAELGLYGKVENESQFRNLYKGFSPDGTEKLAQNAGKESRIAAFDLCFSAIKDTSLIMAFGDKKERDEIWKAHIDSVKETLDLIENEYAFARRGRGGNNLEKGSFVIKLCHHIDSRAHDPDMHTHATVMNGVLTHDKKLRSPNTREFYDGEGFIKEWGKVYRDLMEPKVQKLGYQTKKDGEFYKIQGFTDEQRKTFSQRREEIESYLHARGENTGTYAAQKANFETRSRKVEKSFKDLQPIWRKEGEKIGLNPEYIKSIKTEVVHQKTLSKAQDKHVYQEKTHDLPKRFQAWKKEQVHSNHEYPVLETKQSKVGNEWFKPRAVKLIKAAEAEFLRKGKAFNQEELVSSAMKIDRKNKEGLKNYAFSKVLGKDYVGKLEGSLFKKFTYTKDELDLVAQKYIGNKTRFSMFNSKQQLINQDGKYISREVLAENRKLNFLIDSGKGSLYSHVKKETAWNILRNAEGSNKKALNLTTNKDRISFYRLDNSQVALANKVWKKEHYKVIGINLSKSGAKDFQKQTGIKSHSLAKLKHELFSKKTVNVGKKSVMIVSDSWKLSNSQKLELCEYATSRNAKLVFLESSNTNKAILPSRSQQTQEIKLWQTNKKQVKHDINNSLWSQ